MSDTRFTLKGTFTIYGRRFPFDMSLNWFPRPEDGMDERLVRFFVRCRDEAYMANIAETREASVRAVEEQDRREYDRIRRKYGW